MLAFARNALAGIDASRDADVVVLTARARAADFDAWAADPKSPHFSWIPGDLASSFDAWRVAGDGGTVRVEATGPARWDRIREAACAASSRFIEVREDGVVAPPLRWFGGGSFHPDVRDPIWLAFGGASFVVPRWTIGARGNDAFVRFAFGAHELYERGALLAEIERRLAPSRSHPEASPPRARKSAPPDADASWTPLVLRALADIERGALEKVVVARRAPIPEGISPDATLARLRSQNPECTAFSFRRGDSTFLGATPERLIFSDKTHAFTEALAGTIARREEADDAAKRELLESDKDRREHRLVARGITRALDPFVAGVDHPGEPAVRTLGRVHHLVTPIVAKLARPTHVLSLVDALHPTPALSGFPKTDAFAWIAEHEPFDRGWYGAPVGWFDISGEGAFAVAIRSALVSSERTWLFAGGGIVRGSEPDAELAETRWKLRTMSEALVVR